MAKQPDVEWPTCEQAGCIGIRLASARVCLAHASEEDTAAALKLVSETGAIDARGVSITPALLERILAAAPRGENEGPLIKSCRFDQATFTGDAAFDRVTFTANAGLCLGGPPGDAGPHALGATDQAGSFSAQTGAAYSTLPRAPVSCSWPSRLDCPAGVAARWIRQL